MGFLPGVGGFEMVIVGIIALLLFGKNLPSVAKNLGKRFCRVQNRSPAFRTKSAVRLVKLKRL